MNAAGFREIFPEFGDEARYPDARIQFGLLEASLRLTEGVWGELRESGIAYYVAHTLALAGPVLATQGGGQDRQFPLPAPGLATGLVTSKSVGPVSKSYDVSVGQTDGAGAWNLTTYGQIFATLAASVAVGARQY